MGREEQCQGSLLIFPPLYSFPPSKTLLNKLINPKYFHFQPTSSAFHGILFSFFPCLLTVESVLFISSLFLAFWKKISTAICIHTLTNKRTHKITHSGDYLLIIDFSFSPKISLKNNNYLDFQQEIINYFWLIFCNSKTHQIHTSVDWKLDCETHVRQSFPLPTFQLARNNLLQIFLSLSPSKH